jgi:hypothetical protein
MNEKKKLQIEARSRIRNMGNNCHRKAIKWMCCNYRVTLLHSYETGRIDMGTKQDFPVLEMQLETGVKQETILSRDYILFFSLNNKHTLGCLFPHRWCTQILKEIT